MWTCLVCGNENDDELIRCLCGYEIPGTEPETTVKETSNIMEEEGGDDDNIKWFYELNGSQFGPVSAAVIKNKKLSGELNDDTFVWSSENDEWCPLYNYDIEDNMRESFQKPAPASPNQAEEENKNAPTIKDAIDFEATAVTGEQKEAGKEQTTRLDNKAINRYCQSLGLQSLPSKEELKQTYKDLLIVWNPDRFVSMPSLQQKAHQKIKEIDEAYEKLLLHMAADLNTATATTVSSGSKPAYKPIENNKITSDDNRTKQAIKLFSWKSLIAAVIIAAFLNGIMAAAAGVKPIRNIYWTAMWIYLSIEAWRYWTWKALLPYPLFLLASGISGLIVEGSVEQLSMPYLIVKVTLNIGGLILFYWLLHKSVKVYG